MVLLACGVGVAGACSDEFQSCEDSATCPGLSGSSGEGGLDGNGGEAGSVDGGSGSSGDAGRSGAGAAAGGAFGDAGQAGQAGAGGAGHVCDPSLHPTEERCLVADEHAVFVSPDGDDDNAGTREAPLATLTEAVKLAAASKLVLVCNAIYQQERVSIMGGARIYGGFKCTDWSVEAKRPTFAPTTPGPALRIAAVAAEVLIDNVGFQVADALAAGETALAALVSDSAQVTLQRVTLKAGKGKAGSAGALMPFPYPNAGTLAGNPEGPVGQGGGPKVCECQLTLTSLAGPGGAPAPAGMAGVKGGPEHGGGLGGDPAAGDCGAGSAGKKGGDAPAREPALGAATLGAASLAGWLPTVGAPGSPGEPGQGGGGGASLNASGHGGGGGCGGCGGNGGPGGQGGGASIALLVLASQVTLSASTLTTADAGDGGSGAAGQNGQQESGGGGNPLTTSNSCGGGTGGKGGKGGAGGGGAGGISVGIVWKGTTAPTASTDTTISFGNAGAKGVGGVPGVNDGLDGVARPLLGLVD